MATAIASRSARRCRCRRIIVGYAANTEERCIGSRCILVLGGRLYADDWVGGAGYAVGSREEPCLSPCMPGLRDAGDLPPGAVERYRTAVRIDVGDGARGDDDPPLQRTPSHPNRPAVRVDDDANPAVQREHGETAQGLRACDLIHQLAGDASLAIV
jgi:hypothetical protein